MDSLKGKVALITGAGRGIGRALALKLAAEGAKVALASRTYIEIAEVADQIHQQHGEATAITTDVTSALQVKALVEETKAAYGQIDVVYHGCNAGGIDRRAKSVVTLPVACG